MNERIVWEGKRTEEEKRKEREEEEEYKKMR
jgi:hypothetical protein